MLMFYKTSIVSGKRLFNNIRTLHSLLQKHLADPPYGELLNLDNLDYIQENINRRKANADVKRIRSLLIELENEKVDNKRLHLLRQLKDEIMRIPNDTHPDVRNIGETPKLIAKFNKPPEFHFQPKSFNEIAKKLNMLRMEHLGNFTGHKSYYLMSALAEMEHALIQYTVEKLKQHKFNLVSVPDLLPGNIIEGCGMEINGERTQVYKLAESGLCLSGTSEMALAGYYSNKVINRAELPIKLSAVSRCFRAETSGLQEEKGIYRVHQFTKAEMFSLCTEEQSNDMLESFKEIEINIFKELDLHFQLLDMSPSELGAPAYRKYDIEAWMPGRNMWGEVSSCSNCTDYQAKRLNIKYHNNDSLHYVHTVNGTACAIPRMLIAILECNQSERGTIRIPHALQKYMRGQSEIKRVKLLPELKLVKSIPSPS